MMQIDASLQRTTKPKQINYPLFPPEIRNRIMYFVLRPGNIHLGYSKNGIQLLATNRQNYENGHIMYYSDNMFHIPHSPDYNRVLERYQSKHLKLVRRITLSYSILDLSDSLVTKHIPVSLPSTFGESDFRDSTASDIRKLWIERFLAMQRFFPKLEEFRIDFSDLEPHREWLKNNIDDISTRAVSKAFDDASCVTFRRQDMSSLEDKDFPFWRQLDHLKGPWSTLCIKFQYSLTVMISRLTHVCWKTGGREDVMRWLDEQHQMEGKRFS